MAKIQEGKSGRRVSARTRILSFRSEDSVGYLLRMTSRVFTRAFQERIQQEGITIGMWYYLRALWEQDGVTQSELSQKVGTMDPSTGSALNKMERLGLIYRSNHGSDRRKRYIYLTEKAKKNREVFLRHSVELQDVVERILTPKEVAQLRKMLTKLREQIKNESMD